MASVDLNLPERMFAAGDEPVGERINSYHRTKRTEALIAALDAEELEFLKNSTFGKVISLDENPPFSGAFCQYIIVRLLKVNKKNEIWILFAGRPIRFSLREFAIVTGLNCDQLPESSKKRKKNPLNEKLYWNELFGSLKCCNVDTVIDMLKNRVVKDKDTRIKFACLAITSSILLPSSHNPRIIPEHVELIRDIKEFLDYPWGRVSFHFLITNLTQKNELALSHSSIALKGYVDAIQMVMVAAIPRLKEEVVQNEPVVVVVDSDSDDDDGTEDEAEESEQQPRVEKPPNVTRYQVIPGHARDIDLECEVAFPSILPDPVEDFAGAGDFNWVDELDDPKVERIVTLDGEAFPFSNDLFVGGLTASDLQRMTGQVNPKVKKSKDKQEKDRSSVLKKTQASAPVGNVDISNIITSQLKDYLPALEDRLSQRMLSASANFVSASVFEQAIQDLQLSVRRTMKDIETTLKRAVEDNVKKLECSCISLITSLLSKDKISSTPVPDVFFEQHQSGSLLNPIDSVRGSTLPPPNGQPETAVTDLAGKLISDVLRDVNIDPPTLQEPTLQPLPPTEQSLAPFVGHRRDDKGNQESATVDAAEPVEIRRTIPFSETDATLEDDNPQEAPLGDASGLVDTGLAVPASDYDHLLEEEAEEVLVDAHPTQYVLPQPQAEAETLETRRSKRPRIMPTLYQDYHCDPKIAALHPIHPELDGMFDQLVSFISRNEIIRTDQSVTLTSAEMLDIAVRAQHMTPKVMDVLMRFLSRQIPELVNSYVILETSFPATLAKQHARLVKTSLKDRSKLKFQQEQILKIRAANPDHIYFPFNIDQKHCVGVCVDIKASAVHVLDCNPSLKTDSLLKKEFNPIATVIPYIFKSDQSGDPSCMAKPLAVSRCKGVVQIASPTDAGAMAVLLIQAHSVAGVDGCKAISARVLPDASKQLAVNFFQSLGL